MTKNTHGGKRPGAGRPATDNPKPPPQYLRTPVLAPKTEDQQNAVAWWESLTPRERLAHIKELWFDCGWPEPHKRKSKPVA